MANGSEPEASLPEQLAAVNDVMDLINKDFEEGGFATHMRSDDPLALVLRAHLWIERDLTAIIEAPLPKPHLLKSRWTFIQRVELVAALGIIDEGWLGAYRRLNALRNALAHSLTADVTEEEQGKLIAAIPNPMRGSLTESQQTEFSQPLRRALQLMVFTMQWHRQGLVRRATNHS